MENGAKLFQTSNNGIRVAAIENGFPTNAIDDIMTKTNNFTSISKWAGRSFIAAGVVVSVIDINRALKVGDTDAAKMGLLDISVGLGTAAIGGPIGLIMYGSYILVFHTTPMPSSMYTIDPLSPWNLYERQDNTFLVRPKF